MDISREPGELTRSLAASHPQDPTAWFEDLYRAADAGEAQVPWDSPTPSPLLVEWMEQRRPSTSTRAVVVGAGYGRDAEYLGSRELPTTAFDISPSAVAGARSRFPASPVTYAVGDLLAVPEQWQRAFDLVVESITVQALPEPTRSAAVAGVCSLVAPGGTLLVIAFGFEGSKAARDAAGPPWPLLRDEVESFAQDGLELVSLERLDVR